ncbi:MAG: nucleoside-diphosphate kinase [Legionellales bacterium]|mgnify:CR=1 FL=1|nr:nucleoside-diphosphate kinase [Legionellales bacterium]|tara:strand:- start:2164 stop:2577 length:414 start_codon:yes stop_codon:yes gene_type:complete
MAYEHTLSIIKPDATSRNLIGKIIQLFEGNGLSISACKMLTLTQEQGKEFYIEHKERPFYDDLVSYISSEPVLVQVLSGEDAIAKNRQIMGATNPADAEAGTIRALYAESIDRNSVHGSDSTQSAKREINFFFPDFT